MNLSKTEKLLILLILFGSIIRFWGLGDDLLHVDEKFTIDLILHPFWYVLQFGLSHDCNPPLYYLIDWFSIRIFGLSAWAERFPATIFGILTIPATYYAGREVRDELLGILSAAVVCILGSMCYYSQFGRAYTMICFLFTVAFIFYLRIIRGDASKENYLYFGLLCSLCLWTHLYALIPLGLMTLHVLYLMELKSSPFLYLFLGWLPTLPIAGTFIAIFTERRGIMGDWMGNSIQQLLNYMPLEYFGYAFAIMFGLILIAVWFNKDDPAILSIGWIWALSFTAQLIISVITPVFIRYTLLLVPLLCIMAMEPVTRFIRHEDSTPAQKWVVGGMVGGLFLAIQVYQAMTLYYIPNGTIAL